MSARSRRAAVLAVCLLLALSVAGCAELSAELQTTSALANAGYQNPGMNNTYGTDTPPGEFISVNYSRGPSGNKLADARGAEKIVWDTYPYRFSLLSVLQVPGGCSSLCPSPSKNMVASATHSQLAAKFGPRPPNLNADSPSNPFRVSPWAVILCVLVVVALAIVLPLALWRKHKRRTQMVLGWLDWHTQQPGPAGPPGWPAWQAQPPVPIQSPQPPSMPSPPPTA